MKSRSIHRPIAPVFVILLTLFAAGCGDKGMPTQPLTPTPRPTLGPSTISIDVTLSPTTPPAGELRAALATVVVRETGGRSVRLTGVRASSYYGFTELRVSGFAPVDLAAGQSASFTVTVTAQQRVSCSDKVDFEISAVGQESVYRSVGCENADWPF